MEEKRRESTPGVAAGLAWTEAGGEVLYVETALLKEGKGLTITGHVGPIMKESVEAARSYLWSHAEDLAIDRGLLKKSGVHVHIPAGAIPKDGPSAGIALAAALASLYSGRPIRSDTAMSGEITLAGLVLPVGGVKEKVLAARRARLLRVILPKENEKDLRELPEVIRSEVEFVFVDHVVDVFAAAIPELAARVHAVK
jgi:ATP-dependent Lon protease